jgi:cytochrome c
MVTTRLIAGGIIGCCALVGIGAHHTALAASPKKQVSVAGPTLVGSAERGATLYPERCGGCHSLEVNRVGPAHRGVVGRRSGTAPGFTYSPALKASRFTFNEAIIDRWLTNPQAVVPGTRMFFRLNAPQERADIIAYLKTQPLAR